MRLLSASSGVAPGRRAVRAVLQPLDTALVELAEPGGDVGLEEMLGRELVETAQRRRGHLTAGVDLIRCHLLLGAEAELREQPRERQAEYDETGEDGGEGEE